jgi:Spy/CpxP family protein refolding chaperone
MMKMKWLSTAALGAALVIPAGMLTATAHAAVLPAAQDGYGQNRAWDQPPDDYRDAQRQGFHEGIEAARRDWDRHSHKDMDDHEQYKHPPVSEDLRSDFRDGFKHGYEMAMHHMKDEHHHDDDSRPY